MRSLLAVLMVLTLVSPVLAQTPTATLVGDIKDSSGAAVPGATIAIRNTATNISRTGQTDDSGAYTVLSLAPGPYEVTARIAGFKEVRTVIRLTVGEARRVDFTLEPGQMSEMIEVVGRAPINSERATIGQVIDNKRIVEMPLNGRNFYELATLAPGAISVPSGANLTRSNFVSIYLGGTRARKTAFYLDGIVPSPDALQEFRVQTNNLSAEYGRAGGNLNISMKAGTNEFRGSAYEFFRDDSVSAKNFFATGNDTLSRHQFGATLGGPILKNKTFFFASVEGTRQKRGQTLNLRAPTEDMKKGIFPFTIKDPFANPSARDVAARPGFPANQIPANRISPAAQYFLQYLATANGVDSSGRPVYKASPVQRIDQEQYHLRLDEHLNASNTFFARYSQMDLGQIEPTRSPVLGDYPEMKVRAQNAGIGHTLILGTGCSTSSGSDTTAPTSSSTRSEKERTTPCRRASGASTRPPSTARTSRSRTS
jgi:carboxypeptidase family protein